MQKRCLYFHNQKLFVNPSLTCFSIKFNHHMKGKLFGSAAIINAAADFSEGIFPEMGSLF